MVMKIFIYFFFKIKAGKITRGHDLTLVKEQSRLDVRKCCFSQRIINVLHTLLCTDCVHVSSVNNIMFKVRLGKHLVKEGYTYNKGRLHLD